MPLQELLRAARQQEHVRRQLQVRGQAKEHLDPVRSARSWKRHPRAQDRGQVEHPSALHRRHAPRGGRGRHRGRQEGQGRDGLRRARHRRDRRRHHRRSHQGEGLRRGLHPRRLSQDSSAVQDARRDARQDGRGGVQGDRAQRPRRRAH